MRAVLIGTDFLRDIDGSFKTIETNTNIQLEVETPQYWDVNVLDEITSGTTINEIVYIYKQELEFVINDVDLTELSGTGITLSNLSNDLKNYCDKKEFTYTPIQVDLNSATIPYVEDTPNKLIIRNSYDSTALIDDTYARDNWEYLKLMYNTDPNSIPKTYINDVDLGFDSIGSVLRDNNGFPNYLVKKRQTPADNTIFPKLYKIDTLEQLENLKSSLEVDEYIQEYIYNPSDLLDNRLKTYRSVDLLYGSNLDSLNLWVIEHSNAFAIKEQCDFDDNGEIQFWERPRYLNKYKNYDDKDPHLSGDETTKVLLNDNTRVELSNLSIGSTIKTISVPDLPINELTYQVSEWSTTYENFINNFQIDTATLNNKTLLKNWTGFLYEVTTSDGIVFSDVSQAQILIKTLESGSTENYIVKFQKYHLLSEDDTLLLFDTETSTVVEKQIQSIFLVYDRLNVYMTDFEQIDIFLTMDETSENSRYGILTHNYSYDCYSYAPYGYGGYNCADNAGCFAAGDCGYSACLRCGGGGYISCNSPQVGCANRNCTSYGYYCWYSVTTCSGGYCNGNKSDKRLKKNIKHIKTLKNGIKIYQFEFKKFYVKKGKKENVNLDFIYEGVLAQDLVGTEFNDFVQIECDGYYKVDYDGLGIKLKRRRKKDKTATKK